MNSEESSSCQKEQRQVIDVEEAEKRLRATGVLENCIVGQKGDRLILCGEQVLNDYTNKYYEADSIVLQNCEFLCSIGTSRWVGMLQLAECEFREGFYLAFYTENNRSRTFHFLRANKVEFHEYCAIKIEQNLDQCSEERLGIGEEEYLTFIDTDFFGKVSICIKTDDPDAAIETDIKNSQLLHWAAPNIRQVIRIKSP